MNNDYQKAMDEIRSAIESQAEEERQQFKHTRTVKVELTDGTTEYYRINILGNETGIRPLYSEGGMFMIHTTDNGAFMYPLTSIKRVHIEPQGK